MRRALLLAIAALAAFSPAAAAQSPISGGGSFNDAPVLAPGRYSDTIRGGEQLFFGVTLKPGQQLTAGATVAGKTDTSYLMSIQIYNPLREKDSGDGEQSASYGSQDSSVSLRVEGQRVGEEDGGSSDSKYAEPGTYYISVQARDVGRNLEADQFDVELDLQVTGEIIAQATPTPRPEDAEPADEAAPTQASPGPSSGGDGGGGELGMAIVLGLSLGGIVGFGVRRIGELRAI
jgi:hypothetical protein